jgi:hypothetical protein
MEFLILVGGIWLLILIVGIFAGVGKDVGL